MMLDREDIIRITEEVLKGLRLEVDRSDFTNPNLRSITLKYDDRVLSRVFFDVVQKREYEG